MKPEQMTEEQIENAVVLWAEDRGFLTPKVKFAEKGWPDRLFLSPFGHTIFIEFKRLGGEPDPIQAHRLKELTKRGIPAFCCDSVFSALRILQTCLEPSSLPKASNPATVIASIMRPVSRPWAGEDINSTRYPQNPEGQRAFEKDFNSRPTPGNAEDMAGRNQQVGGLSGSHVDYSTWTEESDVDPGMYGHSPDKP
jgi:hypothetical protein